MGELAQRKANPPSKLYIYDTVWSRPRRPALQSIMIGAVTGYVPTLSKGIESMCCCKRPMGNTVAHHPAYWFGVVAFFIMIGMAIVANAGIFWPHV
jgi:hypothetical protein